MTEADRHRPETAKCGFVAVLGAPNAGKSTLVNRMVGAKVSIATHKVQTTRIAVKGVFVRGDTQLVLVDTPGIFKPKRKLDQAMVQAAWQGAHDADEILLLIDAPHVYKYLSGQAARPAQATVEESRAIITRLEASGRRAVLVLNKIDRMNKDHLLAVIDHYMPNEVFSDVFLISAETGDGVEDLVDHLAARMPEGPWLFEEDQLSDIPLRLLAAEITREKLMLRVHDELPYASMVETVGWKEHKDGSIRVDQDIYVERDSQKAIVIGKGARTIKEIGELARKDLSAILDTPVHLFLNVKVKEKWTDDPRMLGAMGLDVLN